MTGALARLVVEAAGLGRLFFCDIRIATAVNDLEPATGRAIALAERLLGSLETVERRQRPGNVLVQALHDGGAVAQIMVRQAAEESLAVELDGDRAALRLDGAGRLMRHDGTSAVALVDAGTAAALRDFAALDSRSAKRDPSKPLSSHAVDRPTT